jgi:hypothetical protein
MRFVEVTTKRRNPISAIKIQNLYPSNKNQENQEIVRLVVTSAISVYGLYTVQYVRSTVFDFE